MCANCEAIRVYVTEEYLFCGEDCTCSHATCAMARKVLALLDAPTQATSEFTETELQDVAKFRARLLGVCDGFEAGEKFGRDEAAKPAPVASCLAPAEPEHVHNFAERLPEPGNYWRCVCGATWRMVCGHEYNYDFGPWCVFCGEPAEPPAPVAPAKEGRDQ